MLLNIANVYSQDIDGFDFEDNKAQKYLTEKNGVAEIYVKERISLSPILIIYFSILDDNKTNFLHMAISKMVKMA